MTAASNEHRGSPWERLNRAIGTAQPRPLIRLDVGRTVHAGAARLGMSGLMILATAAVASHAIVWIGAAMLIVLSLFRPLAVWASVFLVMIGAALLTTPADPIRTAVVLLAGHLLFLSSNVLGSLPWSGRVELRAFRLPLLRFAVIQPAAQALALLALWITIEGVTIRLIAAVAAVVLAVVVWRVAVRLRARF